MNSVFAARLTKLRRERGMSQKDAAKMLGVSQWASTSWTAASCKIFIHAIQVAGTKQCLP